MPIGIPKCSSRLLHLMTATLLFYLGHACSPALFSKLPPPPQQNITRQVHWFRTQFYRLYLIEKRDPTHDRLRRFVRKFSRIAHKTHRANKRFLEHSPKGAKAQYYALLNLIIHLSLELSQLPPKK
ncbi:MAG: hypothetical protein AAGJ35_02065 [Myxococcota bacterium]